MQPGFRHPSTDLKSSSCYWFQGTVSVIDDCIELLASNCRILEQPLTCHFIEIFAAPGPRKLEQPAQISRGQLAVLFEEALDHAFDLKGPHAFRP